MEVFSLLKYWRTNGGATDANLRTTAISTSTSTSTTTIRHVAETKEEDDDNDDDDGPFFDLEFTVPPEQDCDVSDEDGEVDNDEEEDGDSLPDPEGEFDFTVDSSVSTGNLTDPNLLLSPSDDLFFNGRFVPLEPSELSFSPNESHSKLQFPGALLKPATKLRVLMLGFKKPKCVEKVEIKGESKHQLLQSSKSTFTVKLNVEDVPIISLFTRDNSSRNNKIKQEEATSAAGGGISIGSEDKKYAKDVLQKYLKMVKPLYFRVSRKYGEKSSSSPSPSPSPSTAAATGAGAGAGGGARLFSGQLSPISSPTKKIDESEVNNSCIKIQKEGNLTAGLRNVRKHLGKSRSASSAVAAAPSMAVQSRRHDDSLLQQQDGIQSAILHCKRSFTASRDSDSSSSASSSSTGLSRSTSENLCRES